MTRKKRNKVALISGALTAFIVFVSGVILTATMQSRDEAAQRMAWGPELTCSVINYDLFTGQKNPLVVTGWNHNRVQREVTVACPGGRQNDVMMDRVYSDQLYTSVWHNSQTGADFIRYDVNNGNNLGPAIWSDWPFFLIVVALVAALAFWLMRTWVYSLLNKRVVTETASPAAPA